MNLKIPRICFLIGLIIIFLPNNYLYAHQAPYSVVYMDVSPDKANLEIHIPLTELALAYNQNMGKDPATLLQRMEPQLKAYMLEHTHAYVSPELPWDVTILKMKMNKEQQLLSGPAFWDLCVYMQLLPRQNENTRHFIFDYDAVVHQVINHIVFVTIRSDWLTGRADSLTAESNPMTIRIASDNTIHPLEINLNPGSPWIGFRNMVSLGIRHIREGTDHLMFLLVLLLPSTLVVQKRRWTVFGGTRYSLIRLLKIVTAFTIGHSVTLLLGALNLISPPARIIEILIAVSIFISAIHALYPLFPGREYYVSGSFGLIHGMAFSSVLSGMSLRGSALIISVLGFNIGIELMQLWVVVLTIPWLILLSQTNLYKWFRIVGAIGALLASVAWILERSTGNANFITVFIANEYHRAIWLIVAIAIISIVAFGYNVGIISFKKIRLISR